MTPREIQVKKLIFKFSKQYYEMDATNLFSSYCKFCKDLTNHHKNYFNEINKNNTFISNIHNLFCDDMTKTRFGIKPTDFLTVGLDFNDEELFKYFENLII